MYVISTLQKAGPTNQLLYLLKFLDKKIFDPIIVTLSPEPSDSSYKRFKELGIKVESLNLSRLKGIFLTEVRLNNLVNKYKPSIIQTHGLRADRVKIQYKIPKIITLRTASPKVARPLRIKPGFIGISLASFLHRYHLSYVKKCGLVVVCSKSLSDDLYNLYNVKSRYIQNGVDTDKFHPVSKEIKKKVRNELALPIDEKVYISVGSLIPNKNTGEFIDLFKRWDYLINSTLIVLGKGMEHHKYEQSLNNCENVRILGEIQDVEKYLQASDYFVSASKGEGLSNAVLEAMSSGLPCILSNIKSHQEILTSTKQLGVLFNDDNDLREKITKLNRVNYVNISNNCRFHIQQNFSAHKMSLDYQELYKEILNVP